jgi:hypothetical protein
VILGVFWEGLILLLVGIGCAVAANLWKIDLLGTTAATIIGLALGYFGGTKVGGNNMLRSMTRKIE